MAPALKAWRAPMVRAFLMVGALFLLLPAVYPQYDFNQNCRQAYDAVFSLKFAEARRLIAAEKKSSPGNLVPVYLENFIDFLTIVISEEQPVYERLKSAKGERVRLLEKGDSDSPFHNFLLGEVYLQWAIARVKFGDYASAALEIQKANDYLENNQKKFPAFGVNKLGLGIIHVVASLVPDRYRWVASLAGLKGTFDQGISEIREVANYQGPDPVASMYRDQASFFLVFLTLNLRKNRSEAISLVTNSTTGQTYTSPLMIYSHATVFMRNGMSDKALPVLQRRQAITQTFPFLYLDYLEGMILIGRLDTNAAVFFEKYVTRFKGRNYTRSALQKLAWIALLQGDTAGYHARMSKIIPGDGPLVDEDRQAMKEAREGIPPNVMLLRSRLLFDGGHYPAALTLLLNSPVNKIVSSKRDLVEYNYRLGRIYHESGDVSRAVEHYQRTITAGKTGPWYYAAGAALQLGLLYENSGNYQEATRAYQLCLSIEPEEYKNSLHQKAKAGIERLKTPKTKI